MNSILMGFQIKILSIITQVRELTAQADEFTEANFIGLLVIGCVAYNQLRV